MRFFRPHLLPVAVVVLCAGCAMKTDHYQEVEQNVATGQYTTAASLLETSRLEYGEGSSVLFHLEMGTLQHYGGMVNESIRNLLDAERMMEELYTVSVSQVALSTLLNDNVLPYSGEDFEKVMVNFFLAMNFARAGSYEEALVEARKVDVKLRELSRQYEEKNTYKEDAFVRYVTGVLYEADGEVNDAFIAYRNAYDSYAAYGGTFGASAPSFLQDDLIRTAGLLKFQDDLERYEKLFEKKYVRPPKNQGSILAVVYSGRGPIKVEKKITVSVPDSAGVPHTFSVAVPTFRARDGPPRAYAVRVGGPAAVETHAELAQNITRIAEKNLEERIALIYLKAGGRAVMKFLAAEQAKKSFKKEVDDKALNILFGIVTDVATTVSEQADVRMWRTLPDEIHIARLNLPAGTYRLELSRAGGGLLATDSVMVKAGSVAFAIFPDVN